MSLRYMDAEPDLEALFKKQRNADKAVSAALNSFGTQIGILASMVTSGSADDQLLSDIISWADDAANPEAGDEDWQALKRRAQKLRNEVNARLAKYQAALPQVQALRDT